jgi:nucleoside-diphosphate-sugar epimerase
MWNAELINTVAELEQILSEPYPEDLESMEDLRGGLLILGAGGKMGPTLVQRAVKSYRAAGIPGEVVAVSRFSDQKIKERLEDLGARTLSIDLLNEESLASLPQLPNVIFMTGMKFGSSGKQPMTWAMNSYLPGRVAETFKESRIVAFSTGNVYPLMTPESGGSKEQDPLGPVGEYAQSCLGRERIFEYFSELNSTPMCILRLNYAVEARYGVLIDIAQKIAEDQPINLEMGFVNIIWQGDANSICLRAFDLCGIPSTILNLTGKNVLSVRKLGEEIGSRIGKKPIFEGKEGTHALLNNASECIRIFGEPKIPLEQLLDLTVSWVLKGGKTLGKPTKFQVKNGKF